MAAAKKTSRAKASPEVDVADEADALVIDLDPNSFNRAERREIQARFGINLMALTDFINDALFPRLRAAGDGEVELEPFDPDPLDGTGPDGKPMKVFADDVLIAMATVARKRVDPTATEAMFDSFGLAELRAAVRRGNQLGKA